MLLRPVQSEPHSPSDKPGEQILLAPCEPVKRDACSPQAPPLPASVGPAELWGDLALYVALFADSHPVDARVGRLMDDRPNGGRGPRPTVLALALEAPPRRGDILVVEALTFAVERRTPPRRWRRLRGRSAPLLPQLLSRFRPARACSRRGSSRAACRFFNARSSGSRPLSDGIVLVLRKRGKHLEYEPSRWVGGVYGLGGAPLPRSGFLEPVVGVHDDEQGPPQPDPACRRARIELARPALVAAPAATAASPGDDVWFLVRCNFSHRSLDDPIVHPTPSRLPTVTTSSATKPPTPSQTTITTGINRTIRVPSILLRRARAQRTLPATGSRR